MKTTEFIIMILYIGFCIFLAFYTQRKISSSASGTDEYYVAGRRIGLAVNSIAILAALGSGGSFMAGIGTNFKLGLPTLAWMTVASICGFALASILVAKPLRNSGKYTVTEFLTERYNSRFIQVMVPIILIIGSGIYLMSQMKAGGLIASYITGLSYEWGLVIIALVFILYVSLGGMLAVTWTNVLQGALMILLILLIVIGGLVNAGQGPISFFASTTKEYEHLGKLGVALPLAAGIGAFVSWFTAPSVIPHLVMRVFTAKDVYSARLSMNIGMLIYGTLMFTSLIVILPFVPELGADTLKNTASDMWLLLIANKFFGPFIMGIITAGIMAAVMSTTDALLLACSASFAYDLYGKVINTKASQKQLLRAATISTWVIGILVMLITLKPHPFLIVLYTAAVGFMASGLFPPMVLGIWWKRANTIGASVSMVVGSVLFMILFLGFDMPYNTEILIALPVSMLTMLVVSSLTEKPSEETIAKMEQYHTGII
ncbi:sodium:solute symporter family protein [Desulfallas sp. Bu1-1]|uniref:sodium:solute symporter family protein n=1 Tax=Desulfallas sp. Bu1-1 TaxID=2787620 RepID=UPI00189D025B|nr:sodium:solute symporter family protein [Desulfallas sp. Bu1-1]MBF7082751.1 sodium:solute symporter family protein [Desulfallas sp. Bu1-1]